MSNYATDVSLVPFDATHMEGLLEIDEMSFCWHVTAGEVRIALENDHRLVVAVLGSDVLGYLFWRRCDDGFEIDRIGVHPSTRRRGIGWRLFNFIEQRCTLGMSRITVDVDSRLFFDRTDFVHSVHFLRAMQLQAVERRGFITIFEKVVG